MKLVIHNTSEKHRKKSVEIQRKPSDERKEETQEPPTGMLISFE